MTYDTAQHPEELLPWYVNNTLSAQERRQVESHLKDCTHCRAEVELLRSLHAQVQRQAISAPGELGLKRLQRAIKRERKTQSAPAWWRPALATAALVVVIQSALLVSVWQQPGNIQPLGVDHAGVVLQLRFDPKAREAQIRQLLGQIDGELIGGPGALGVYHVRLDEELTDQDIAATIEHLKTQSDIVTHVSQE